MKKIINPCTCLCWTRSGNECDRNAFAEINYTDGRLSIHGVVDPRRGGNCGGSYGQCVDEIRNGNPKEGWTKEMLAKFCDIWDEWHLNDTRPYCQHQKELGWHKEAGETIYLCHYKLKDEYRKIQDGAKESAIKALKNGETFTPTAEQTKFANLPYFYDTYDELIKGNELYDYYTPYKDRLGKPEKEAKIRGWVWYDTADKTWCEPKSDKGILGKPCPVCGYKYGYGWQKEEVPQEIIDWLFALPETQITPAWI